MRAHVIVKVFYKTWFKEKVTVHVVELQSSNYLTETWLKFSEDCSPTGFRSIAFSNAKQQTISLSYISLVLYSHAIESYTAIPYQMRGPRPPNPSMRPAYQGSNPVSDVWAKHALSIVSKYLKRSGIYCYTVTYFIYDLSFLYGDVLLTVSNRLLPTKLSADGDHVVDSQASVRYSVTA